MSDDHLRVLLVDDDEEDALLTKELLAESLTTFKLLQFTEDPAPGGMSIRYCRTATTGASADRPCCCQPTR